MAKYRRDLPQLSSSNVFLTDGGLETDLIFKQGFDLPLFASFPLLETAKGVGALRDYYAQYAQIARDTHLGFVLEAVTWRANRDWASQLGYDATSLSAINRRAVELLVDLRAEFGEAVGPIVLSAAIGPRGDAYDPDELMTPEEAESYHREQIATLAGTDADLITALTLTHAAEAIGIVRAAQTAEMPVVISFTVESDGALPDGSSLAAAIREVDEATDSGPAYYGINCAHPTHFGGVMLAKGDWTKRIQMIRGNASRLSHTELDNAATLDDGNPEELGGEYLQIRREFPHVNVLGGCCGTDARHIEAIARACCF
jgi:S-methylmethionine-dependent homocysteine/selenocysteine methylase